MKGHRKLLAVGAGVLLLGVLLAAVLLFATSAKLSWAADATSRPATAPARVLTADHDGDFVIGPPYAPAAELTVGDNVPRGEIHRFTMDSADSKIYPGIRGHYSRAVAVYVPKQYVPGTVPGTAAGKGAPFIVVQDGTGGTWLNTMPAIMDNMINEHRLPVMIGVFVNNGGGDGKGSERGLEYDTVSGKYAEFIETEVLPRIARDYGIKFTTDPDGRAAAGGSSGGAAAFSMGWFHPDLYHRILTYSGTYVDQQSPLNPELPHGAWEYHEHLIHNSDRKPLRVWLEVGENDNGSKRDEASLHNWVMANQRMAAALEVKGYPFQYVYAENAGHVDRKVVNQTMPEAMEWLWKDYPKK